MTSNNIYSSPLCSCIICREVKSAKGIHSHYLYAHQRDITHYENCHSVKAREKTSNTLTTSAIKTRQDKEAKYNKSPTKCAHCGCNLSYQKKRNKYCSKSCSAAHNNSLRGPRSLETKLKIANTLTKPKWQDNVVGPFSKIYMCTCKLSGIKWCSNTVKSIYPDLVRSKTEYRRACQFTFSIRSYEKWFTNASDLITKYGWYSTPGSRAGVKNHNGISRDHMVSVNDGYLLKIPPSVIRHPANCELMPHKANQHKNTKSSITVSELYQRIENFQNLYPERYCIA